MWLQFCTMIPQWLCQGAICSSAEALTIDGVISYEV